MVLPSTAGDIKSGIITKAGCRHYVYCKNAAITGLDFELGRFSGLCDDQNRTAINPNLILLAVNVSLQHQIKHLL